MADTKSSAKTQAATNRSEESATESVTSLAALDNSAAASTTPSAVDTIAMEVRKLLGGDNPNQFFTMLMPGTIIEASRYSYDINAHKPATVAVAESHLVNQLFDVCEVTASPNGRHLGSQYIAALNLLVPRFSPELTVVKNALRDFLRATPNHTNADGTPYTGTVQDLYFELFNAWVEKKQEWESAMQAKHDELAALYAEDSRRVENEFIEWYESVAEGRLLELDAYMGKVLAFFSPSDMDTILGVLDSGPGREIHEARRAAEDAERPSPDGGKVYPVDLTPADWFTSLASDAEPEDLLNDPLYIGFRLQARRSALLTTVNQVKWLIASRTGDLVALRKEVDEAQTAYDTAQNNLMSTYGKNLLIAYEVYQAVKGGGASDATSALDGVNKNKKALDGESDRKGEKVEGTDAKKDATKEALEKVIAGQDDLIGKQSAFMASARKLNDAARELLSAQASTYDVEPYLVRLESQLEEVENLRSQLVTAAKAAPPAAPAAASTLPDGGASATGPSSVSDRFMDLTMSFEASSMSKNSAMSSSSWQSGVTVDLFLGSYSGASSGGSAYSSSNILDTETSVEIGMKITKVDIDRPWFDPGVFLATKDLDRMSQTPVSVGAVPTSARNKADLARANASVLPCYPVSFVIAKDITIRFKATESGLNAAKTVIDSKSAYGGGFLCFSAKSTSSSHYEQESVTSKTEGNVITLRINAPQIIGWFSEFVPSDQSFPIVTSDSNKLSDVLTFIKTCTDQLKPAASLPPVITPGNGRPLPAPGPAPVLN